MSQEDSGFEVSRRKALAGLGTIGVASAGAGLGTSAFFSDEERFENNQLAAGELDLIVDYYTSSDQGSAGSSFDTGEVNGTRGATYSYNITDVKPGDSGKLAFCPKIVDNPGWLFVGSDGVTDYENGQTEPEADVDNSGGGTLGNNTNDGAGAGELSDAIDVTVSYAESVSVSDSDDDGTDEIHCNNTRELNNPDDYTVGDLALELQTGFLIDGDLSSDGRDAYPSSSDGDDQQGPCLCIEWEVPTDVGNEIQSDAVDLDFTFAAIQERHNPDPNNPFVEAVYTAEDSDGVAKGWQSNWDSSTVTALSNFSGVDEPRVEISYGSSQVVFQIHLADPDELVVGSGSNDSASLPVDVDDDGTTDFEVAFRGDPDGAAPSGENFGYRTFTEGSGPGTYVSVDSVVDVDAIYNGTTITIGIGRNRLTSGGDAYRFAWQEIYRSGSSPIQGIKIPFSVPRWKFEEDGDGDFADSDNFAQETVQ